MIFTGLSGAFTGGGESTQLIPWGTVSAVFWIFATVVVEIGFRSLIHRVAQLGTTEDVRAGEEHPEAIWVSSIKQSHAGVAREVYLAQATQIHPQRTRAPPDSALPADQPTSQPANETAQYIPTG